MPNTDYLITQRKMKRIKNETTYIASNGTSEYTMMNMNPILNGTNTLEPNSQMFTANSYLNQNNYATNNANNLNYNYSNSYYDWSTNSNFNYTSQFQNTGQQMIAQNFSQANSNHTSTSSSSNTTTPIEDTLEIGIRDLIKVIHQAYQVYLSPLVQLLKDELNKNSSHFNYQQRLSQQQNQYQNFQANFVDKKNLHEIVDHLRFYARKFANFSENIPGLGKLTTSDKEELIKCSIHSVVLLSLQRKCDHFNYFNGEQAKIERFHKEFPILFRTNYFMKTINEKFEKFKLDEKEYALYSALLVISTGKLDNLKVFIL